MYVPTTFHEHLKSLRCSSVNGGSFFSEKTLDSKNCLRAPGAVTLLMSLPASWTGFPSLFQLSPDRSWWRPCALRVLDENSASAGCTLWCREEPLSSSCRSLSSLQETSPTKQYSRMTTFSICTGDQPLSCISPRTALLASVTFSIYTTLSAAVSMLLSSGLFLFTFFLEHPELVADEDYFFSFTYEVQTEPSRRASAQDKSGQRSFRKARLQCISLGSAERSLLRPALSSSTLHCSVLHMQLLSAFMREQSENEERRAGEIN